MIKLEEIDLAYRKLKHSVYYDTTYSFIRSELASFEQNNDPEFTPSTHIIKTTFEEIKDKINTKDEAYFDNLIRDITYWQLPKKIDNNTLGGDDPTILTNTPKEDSYINITRDFKLIKADIKLHIINVLWILKGGFLLEKEMKVKPYGNRLELKDEYNGVVDGLRLFKPYFERYKKWRDEAFKKAKQIISEKENVLLVVRIIDDVHVLRT